MKLARAKMPHEIYYGGSYKKSYALLAPFITRTLFIYTLGIEYLGLNGLFGSVLSVLNLAELGVGNAMIFSMYKAIAEDDEKNLRTSQIISILLSSNWFGDSSCWNVCRSVLTIPDQK